MKDDRNFYKEDINTRDCVIALQDFEKVDSVNDV